jgi:hypothetical protein
MARLGLTHDKSHIAGRYKSEIACGLESKPIRTSATLYSLAVAFGILARNKLRARTFGDKNNGELGMQHKNCSSIQK